MLNVSLIKHHFVLRDGRLFKRLSDGTHRPINTVRAGRLVGVVSGVSYYGPEIAWALYYDSAPMFPVLCVDGDPLNLAQENIVAARIKRVRFRWREVRGGFAHTLARAFPFKSLEMCRDDWVYHARKYYAADHEYVRHLEFERDRALGHPGYTPAVVKRAPPKPKPPVVGKRPAYIAGFRAYYHDGVWVQVPEACHAADDYRERCRRVLLGAVRFEFNHATQMVEGFDAQGVLVP